MKTSGIQRCWLVVAFFWVTSVVAYSYIWEKSEADLYHAWSQELLDYIVTERGPEENYTVKSFRSAHPEFSDKDIVDFNNFFSE